MLTAYLAGKAFKPRSCYTYFVLTWAIYLLYYYLHALEVSLSLLVDAGSCKVSFVQFADDS